MAHLLLSPLTWGLLLLAWRHATRRSWLRGLQAAAIAACLLLSAPIGANALVWMIENRLQTVPACSPTEQSPLLMLTGGLAETPRDVNDFGALTLASLRRVEAVVRLAGMQPGSAVYISGGPDGELAESRIAAGLAQRLGLPQDRLQLEARSQNTWQNAQEMARLLPSDRRRVQLVTSKLHAPRAAMALRAHGIAACRHDVDSAFTPPTGLGYLAPQSSSLAKAERSFHELLGLASYALKSPATR